MKPTFTLATGDYDRVRALWDGTLVSEMFDLDIKLMTPDKIFPRMVENLEFDIAEMSLSTYLILLSKGIEPFVAIPVFPSRKFRHGDVYVRTDSSYNSPADLAGKTIGISEYQLTALVWIRGMFSDDFAVAAKDVCWLRGGVNIPGRKKEKVPIDLPIDIKISDVEENKSLTELLLEDKIDAIMSPQKPGGIDGAGEKIRKLFDNYEHVERAYYNRTGVFPIIHVVVIKKDIIKKYPNIASELYRLYSKAKDICYEGYNTRWALKVSLPWFDNYVDQTLDFMGRDFWSYGLEKNKFIIETFIRYMHEQGLISKKYTPEVEELFVPVDGV